MHVDFKKLAKLFSHDLQTQKPGLILKKVLHTLQTHVDLLLMSLVEKFIS